MDFVPLRAFDRREYISTVGFDIRAGISGFRLVRLSIRHGECLINVMTSQWSAYGCVLISSASEYSGSIVAIERADCEIYISVDRSTK
jgi:hypothetical protein